MNSENMEKLSSSLERQNLASAGFAFQANLPDGDSSTSSSPLEAQQADAFVDSADQPNAKGEPEQSHNGPFDSEVRKPSGDEALVAPISASEAEVDEPIALPTDTTEPSSGTTEEQEAGGTATLEAGDTTHDANNEVTTLATGVEEEGQALAPLSSRVEDTMEPRIVTLPEPGPEARSADLPTEPTELLVRFSPGASAAAIEAAAAAVGGVPGKLVRDGGPFGDDGVLQVVRFGAGLSMEKAIDILSHRPGIELVEPNWSLTAHATSNDYFYGSGALWGMYGDQTSPANVYGSQAGEAWADGHVGSMSTVIGIVDTGIDPTHADLYLNIWLNQEEIPTSFAADLVDTDSDGLITFRDLNDTANSTFVTDINANGRIDAIDLLRDTRWADGLDSDGNGFIDDFYGWDFWDGDNNPFEDYTGGDPDAADSYHGTHVAGTIGGVGGNGTGVAGMAWNTQLMSLRFLGPEGGYTSGAIQALDYYTAQSLNSPGQDFVATNNSWGGGGFSESLETAIADGAKADILFVAAAGNSSADNDAGGHYPSNYDTTAKAGYDAVIAVASLDSGGGLSSFSNYGATSVDLAAPGGSVLSTLAGGNYAYLSGTSMAAPHVTGAIALAAAANPDMTAEELRNALLQTAASTASVNGRVVTDGRLDASALLDTLTLAGPTQVVTIVAAEDNAGEVTGPLSDGAVTDDTLPVLSGTLSAVLETDQSVVIYRDGTSLGTSTVTQTEWSYAPTELSEGTHVFTARVEDSTGGVGSLSAGFDLTVDLTAPTVSVDVLVTADASPALSGSVNDPDATVGVTVADQTMEAINNGDGTWSVVDDALTALLDGTYNVSATAMDVAGNKGMDSTTGELTIDTDVGDSIYGTIEADILIGTSGSDIISGLPKNTADMGAGAIDVLTGAEGADVFLLGNLNGRFYDDGNDRAGNNGQNDYARITDFGTGDDALRLLGPETSYHFHDWTQDGFSGTGVFFDSDGNGRFGAKDELIALVENVAPTAFTFTPDGDFTEARLTGSEVTTPPGDTTPPAVTVDGLTTTDTTPALSGTVDDPDATIQVTVNSLKYAATNDGDGTWSLADNTLPELAVGTYDVIVTATDAAGNVGIDSSTDELVIEAGGTVDGVIYGTDGNDVLTGSAGDDTLNGLPNPDGGSSQLGEGTIDRFTGGEGADIFVFGDERGIYYDDDNPRSGNTGKNDYGHITDFEIGTDKIQLKGTADDYFLVAWSIDDITGTGIVHDSDGAGGYDAKDELIGFVGGVNLSALSDTDFLFV